MFDIKRFAVHNGPGIRTTIFFKGCPLHCLWFHNAERIEKGLKLMPHPSRCTRDCRDCVKAAPRGPYPRSTDASSSTGRSATALSTPGSPMPVSTTPSSSSGGGSPWMSSFPKSKRTPSSTNSRAEVSPSPAASPSSSTSFFRCSSTPSKPGESGRPCRRAGQEQENQRDLGGFSHRQLLSGDVLMILQFALLCHLNISFIKICNKERRKTMIPTTVPMDLGKIVGDRSKCLRCLYGNPKLCISRNNER